MNTQTQIIPYNAEALRWHLTNNTGGMHPNTIEQIIKVCEEVNNGEKDLSDEIAPNTGISIGEMLDDLKIDYCE